MAGQSRAASAFEALANIAVGLSVAFCANLVVLPLFGVPITVGQVAGVSVVFTAISLVRSYVLRRIFNMIGVRKNGG